MMPRLVVVDNFSPVLAVQENKILHVQHMLQLGLQLVVHPEAFVVHYPHSYSASELTVKADEALQHKVRRCNFACIMEGAHKLIWMQKPPQIAQATVPLVCRSRRVLRSSSG